ncbi:AGE family epimerase/isomerase [Psychrosphaera sp. B3R10]|uniref:AGE family epimerase/isomerase n=1 Tax=unclassified Psychrosphaera TaxID=2641570 RepID=UPI001C09C6C8|nr:MULTISPECIES: AGE family epimerase/isomerase [unclassified Psychrosphaera]MBU2880544.1 AGE family epimerase/isomerase [Psychrosphaera sp. I2R16]MBU2989135.1 AGE family epimerase/isomerase [Psychrosphaera sp. B3R10]MDO6717792.1 AGE family epimerase/isomerase [Psychrosphaera sp. 1_MG-2023]
MSSSLFEKIYQFESWLKNQAIPFWSQQGIDEHGASYEKFNADASPDLTSNRRVRVQTRQMFVFALAQNLGWIDNGTELIANLNAYLLRFAKDPTGQHFVHILDKDHNIINRHQDLYDVAFLLLSYGWRYHVLNDLNALNAANLLLGDIDIKLKDHPGGWKEGDYDSPYRRQNPHMHLFEAFLTLYKFTRDGKWLAKAGEIFCLFETQFFDHENGVLLEFFTDNWQPVAGEKGNIVEPGHMMEWVWLLREYQKYTQAPVDKYCHELYHNAIKLGLDKSGELLVDEINHKSKVTTGNKRCWPMTEWLKASLAQAQYTKSDHDYLSDANKAVAGLLKHFIRNPDQGRYIDQLNNNNEVINDTAPASTLYHLIMAGYEATNYVQSSPKELIYAVR